MTYLNFHLIFTIPPILLLGWRDVRRLKDSGGRQWRALIAVILIAVAYTTPWDNYLVSRGIWGYGEGRILGTIGYVPVEEYLFFVLQPFLTGLWLFLLHSTSAGRQTLDGAENIPGKSGAFMVTGGCDPVLGGTAEILAEASRDTGVSGTEPQSSAVSSPAKETILEKARRIRISGAILYASFTLAGILLLRSASGSGTYLGLILLWASPVLAGQWLYAGHVIAAQGWRFALAVLGPTLYLWAADATALHLGIWHISERYTLGLAAGPLPLEEAVFFLATNLLVVQGLLLFLCPPRAVRFPVRSRQAIATSRR